MRSEEEIRKRIKMVVERKAESSWDYHCMEGYLEALRWVLGPQE